MILASAYFQEKNIWKIVIKGHADYANFGQDIVCAAVSSAVQMTINAITEIVKIKTDKIKVSPAKIEIEINQKDMKNTSVQQFMHALVLQIEQIEEEYPKNIKLLKMGG